METLLALILVGLAILALYLVVVRPWQLRWGATDEEVAQRMTGDDVVTHPSFVATRAVTIKAKPADIWSWLVQIGSKRAGFYSIDWIDNAGIASSEHIISKLQHMNVGDFVPMTPDGKNGMWVKDIETHAHILWWDKKGDSTWLWQLTSLDDKQTRLITRLRVLYDWTLPWVIYYLLQDVGDIVMMRKCLLGIKRRAEATVQSAG